jgi:hypothetical protein
MHTQARYRFCAFVITAVTGGLLLASGAAQAATVPAGTYDSYFSAFSDVNAPVSGLVNFDQSGGGLLVNQSPVDRFEVMLEQGTSRFFQDYSNVQFNMDNLTVGPTLVAERGGTADGPDAGDSLEATFTDASDTDPGTNPAFSFTDGGGDVIVEGTFTAASLTGTLGEHNATLSFKDVALAPGPGFAFDDTVVDSLGENYALAMSLVGIPESSGLTATENARDTLFGQTIYDADLSAFGVADGSIDTSAESVSVVPEPASLALFGIGVSLLAAGQRRRHRQS